MKRIGAMNVLLVTEHLDKDELLHSFPTIAKRLDDEGIELGKDPTPVAPKHIW